MIRISRGPLLGILANVYADAAKACIKEDRALYLIVSYSD